MRPIVLLPGMGADERMYAPLRRLLPSLRVLRFADPAVGEDLPAYGRRLAAQVPPGAVLGGSSFGGMVACEMARHCAPSAIVLIGSATRPSQMPLVPFAALLRLLPDASLMARPALGLLAALKFGVADPRQRRCFATMAQDTGSAFIRWAAQAIARWNGVTDRSIPAAIRSIHGAQDRLIPARGISGAQIVPGAGHLLAMTHPAPVAAFLRRLAAPDSGLRTPDQA